MGRLFDYTVGMVMVMSHLVAIALRGERSAGAL
jgi:hypothetical protein